MLASFILILCTLLIQTSSLVNTKRPKLPTVTTRLKSSTDFSPNKVEKVFIFGLGYTGSKLAENLLKRNITVVGTCTNVNKAISLSNEGIKVHLFDEKSVHSQKTLNEMSEDILSSTHVLCSIPPFIYDESSIEDLSLETCGDEIRKAALSGRLEWLGYLSSTGVYGNCDGNWVDENQPVNPTNLKTAARVAVEKKFLSLHKRSGLPVHVFRLAGIYGSDRSALDMFFSNDILQAIKSFKKSKQLDSLRQIREMMRSVLSKDDFNSYISRIHVDDIVATLVASMSNPTPGIIYNVADDLPSTRFDAISYCCRIMDIPLSVTQGLQTDARGVSNRGGSKRVDNTRLRDFLQSTGATLKYPDYRVGLSAIADLYREQGRLENFEEDELRKTYTEVDAISSSPNRANSRISDLEERMGKLEVIQNMILTTLDSISESLKKAS